MNMDWRTRQRRQDKVMDLLALLFVIFWVILSVAWVGLWVWVIIELVGWVTSL